MGVCTLLYILLRFVLGYANILIDNLYAAFVIVFLILLMYKRYGQKSAHGLYENGISIVGRSSLQIYTLHFFFLPIIDLPILSSFEATHNSLISELFLNPLISMAIIALSILASKCIYRLRLGIIFGR